VPVRHDREFWERACREVRRGARVADVARRTGVKPRTLQWWSWKLRREPDAEPAEFLPVVVGDQMPPVSTSALELEANGVRIRVEPGTDVQYVAALVVAIRAAC
jgi:transposase-like protein